MLLQNRMNGAVSSIAKNSDQITSCIIEDVDDFLCNYQGDMLNLILDDDYADPICREILSTCWVALANGKDNLEVSREAQIFIDENLLRSGPGDYV